MSGISEFVKHTNHQATRDWERKRTLTFFMGVNRLLTRVYHHVDVESPSKIPRTGPAILVSNHISGLDPLVIQSGLSRPVVWMTAKEYCENPSISWLFKLIEAIPVERSGKDLAAMRSAMRTLDSGKILGVFPEGKIAPTRALLPFQTGVALMALKTGAKVFPACIEGTSRGREVVEALLRPCDMQLSFGDEIKFDRKSSSRESLQAATQAMRVSVARLQHNHPHKINRSQ